MRAYVTSLPIYLFIFLVFLNRYVFGLYLTIIRRKTLDETIEGYEPTVTVVVPLYNEGRSIYDTIVALVNLDYPKEKLEVTVVDDCSTDDSYEWACKAAAECAGWVVRTTSTALSALSRGSSASSDASSRCSAVSAVASWTR